MSTLSGFIGVDDSPEMIAFCTERCPHKSCPHGCCDEYIAAYRERHPRKKQGGGRPPLLYTARGQRRSLDEWAGITGISKTTMYRKMRGGLTLDEIIEEANA